VPVAPPPARAPQPVPVPVAAAAPRPEPAATATAVAPAAAAAAPRAEAAPSAAARAAPPTPRAARPASHRKITGALIALGAVAVAAFLAASFLGSGADPQGVEKGFRLDLERATDLQRAGDLDGAAEVYARIATAPGSGDAGAKAARYLQQVRSEIADANREFERLWDDRTILEPSEARLRFDDLERRLGKSAAARHRDVVSRIEAFQRAWFDANRPPAEAKAAALAKDGRFAAALASWEQFRLAAPQVDEGRRTVEDGRAAVAALANLALADVVRQASAVETDRGPKAAADLLRARIADFAGTPAASALEFGAETYERAAIRVGMGPPATGPTPRPGTKPAPGAGTPPPSAPGTLPPAEKARLDALLADAEAKVAGRQFAAAVVALEEALAIAPKGSPEAVRAAGRRDDATLARDGLDLLGRTVREHPDRFARMPMTEKFAVDLVDADAEFLVGIVSGGRTKFRWAALDVGRLAAVVDRAKLPPREGLPLAALLRAFGAQEPAERALLRLVEDGGDLALAHATLARWRGEAVPPGGYVPYEGRLVSPKDRERLVLAARISQAVAKVSDKSAAVRKAAVQDLLSLGEAGKEPLYEALQARRKAAIAEIAAMKVFSAGKTRARLHQELEKRRAAALALIENAAAYPYPSPTHEGQVEVNRLVDLVRECWYTPFDLIASWDDGVAKALSLVTEVDDVLAKTEIAYRPDMDVVKAAANKAVDMPGYQVDEAWKQVLAYNERLATSATREEKANVLAVNEYRIMMGRHPVKIDERLVRAARGHSIEMVKLKYFAHDGPTPGLRSPGERAAREGYGGGVGENIATGAGTGREAFDLWFHSSGHHRNMISRGWTEMGCGRSAKTMWTQKFGGMTGKGLKGPEGLPPLREEIAPEPDEGEPPAPDPTPPGKGKKGRGRVGDKPPPGPPPDEPPDRPEEPGMGEGE
jgi:uncharacterized protein YkwD